MLPITTPKFNDAEIEEVKACLESGWVTQGPRTIAFEKLIASAQQVKYARATTSCTAALHLAVLALDLGPGDEVIVPAFTWVTSAHAPEYVNAKPVFIDIEPHSYNIDPKLIESKITHRTRAIIVVHLFGRAANMGEIQTIAKKHNLFIIEDAACAIGTTWKGKSVGGLGDLGCFSFHPRKVVTTGEGGAVTSNNDQLIRKVEALRNHGATGLPKEYAENPPNHAMATFNAMGFNLRLSDILASVGIPQMNKLNHLLEERKKLAKFYLQNLRDLPEIQLPDQGEEADGHTYQSFVISLKEGGELRRNELVNYLSAKEIMTRPGTHTPPLLGYYKTKYHYKPADFPVAANAEKTTITLPVFPDMKTEDIDYVCACLKQGLKS